MNRRTLLRESLAVTALAASTGLVVHHLNSARLPHRASPKSKVAILRCERYEACLPVIVDGLRLLAPTIQRKRVLLKPNLVEYSPTAPINTHPVLISATIEALYRYGASSVVVAEGPGHIRDTELLLEESGLRSELQNVGHAQFVDLNFDTVYRVLPATGLTRLNELWLPQTVLSADVIISMPKIKTHHWAGVTLSLKNLFGTVPGSVYGWPKNILHWEGIENSIVELAASIPIHYVIADGVIAMEGNGPLHGSPRPLGCIVFADDPVAADATCCRLMGIDPALVRHLQMAAPLGNMDSGKIDQLGEGVESVRQQFELLPQFSYLRGSI